MTVAHTHLLGNAVHLGHWRPTYPFPLYRLCLSLSSNVSFSFLNFSSHFLSDMWFPHWSPSLIEQRYQKQGRGNLLIGFQTQFLTVFTLIIFDPHILPDKVTWSPRYIWKAPSWCTPWVIFHSSPPLYHHHSHRHHAVGTWSKWFGDQTAPSPSTASAFQCAE